MNSTDKLFYSQTGCKESRNLSESDGNWLKQQKIRTVVVYCVQWLRSVSLIVVMMWAQQLVFSQTRLSFLVTPCISLFWLSFEMWIFFLHLYCFLLCYLNFWCLSPKISALFFFPKLLPLPCVCWEDFAVCWPRGSCETSSWFFCFLQGSGHSPAARDCVNKIAGSSRNRGRKQESSTSLWFSPGQCSQCVGAGFFCVSLCFRSWGGQPRALLSRACRQWKKSNLQPPGSVDGTMKCWHQQGYLHVVLFHRLCCRLFQ